MFQKLLLALCLLTLSLTSASAGPVGYTNIPYGTDPIQVLDIWVPPTAGLHPLVVMIHGGGWSAGDKEDLTGIARTMCGFGYTVVNINYHLDTPTTNQYPTAINDCFAAVAWVKANGGSYHGNTQFIAAFGTSAGGSMAQTLGNSGVVNAVCDFYGPNDFTDPTFLNDSLNGVSNSSIMLNYLGYTYAQDPSLYMSASPIFGVFSGTAPTIIFHGLADTAVPPQQSINLYNDLTALGIPTQLNLEPGLAHGFLTSLGYNPNFVINQCVSFLHSVQNSSYSAAK